MAGLDQVIDRVPAPENTPPMNAPSLPLYAAGAIITLCSILAANAALTQPDYGWIAETILLTGAGFLFSYGSRRLGVAPRVLDYGFAGGAAILLACVAAGLIAPAQLLPAGADRSDERLMAGLVWGGAVWAWALRSDNRVVGATVPTMAVLGMAATIDVNTPVLVCFGAFILTVIFLLIHQNYLQNRGRASQYASQEANGASDTPPRRLLLAQVSQAGLCGLAVLLLGMLVIVPAQVVFSHLSLSQAIRHLAAIQSGAVPVSTVERFSDDDNLAIGTGDAWSSSPNIVMRVTPSDGQPYDWRGRTYDVYTGDGWQSSLENDHQDITVGSDTPLAGQVTLGIPDSDDSARADNPLSYALPARLTPGDPGRPGGSAPLTAVFEVRGETNQFYYGDVPQRITFNADAARDTGGVQVCRDGRLGLVSGGPVRFPYQITFQPPPDPAQPGVLDRLRSAGTAYPADVRLHDLSQSPDAGPDDLAFYKQCVADALQSLPAGQRDPLDEAEALRLWVSRRCVYTLTPPPLPEDTDHVHAFLGDTRLGYCDMFASSLAILCRTAGIPARLAVGFAPGDPDGSSFNLRAEDKHAWTEVYFPGTGWLALDATAGSTTDGTVPTTSGSRKSSWLSRLHFGLSNDWQLAAPLVGLIALLLGYVAKTELYDPWRLKRRTEIKSSRAVPPAPGRDLKHPYARLTSALARLGLPRRLGETPNEYAARVLPLLPPLEREGNVALSPALVSDLTDAFTRACYADPALPLAPSQPWDSRVAAFDAAARRLLWSRFWRRLTLHREPTPPQAATLPEREGKEFVSRG